MFDLTGTSALVTGVGAKGGIGFATARALLEHGAGLIITSTTERVFEREAELEELASMRFGHDAPKIHAQITDLSDTRQVEYFFHGISKLDILVNNAGMNSLTSPSHGEEADLTQVTDQHWQSGLQRNLDTAFKVTRRALPVLRQSGRGRIIMVSSVTGGRMAMRNQPTYATAKAALLGLTRALALDEAPFGVTCNAVLPGWIATDSQPKHEANQGMASPLRRSGWPEEVAAAILWLASKEAGYVTGQELVIDGGNSIAEERN